MQPRHVLLAVVLSIFWGLNFVVITVALTDFPPLFLASLRFVIAALPALFLARPPVRWSTLIVIGLTLFVGQFALAFPAMAIGMPPGLASIVFQAQAFFTIAIAVLVLRERPTARQLLGGGVTLAGLALIATTIGVHGVTFPGLALALCSAALWATGNVLLRRAGEVDMLSMISWLSVVAVFPLLALSLAIEGPVRLGEAVTHASWLTVGAVLYIGIISTIFGYGVWGHLLKLYPASTVAPFALLVPVSGTISAALLLGESFGPWRLAGMALIMLGLAVLVLGSRPQPLAIDPG